MDESQIDSLLHSQHKDSDQNTDIELLRIWPTDENGAFERVPTEACVSIQTHEWV